MSYNDPVELNSITYGDDYVRYMFDKKPIVKLCNVWGDSIVLKGLDSRVFISFITQLMAEYQHLNYNTLGDYTEKE